MSQPTLLSFKPPKIKIPDPSQNIKTNNPPTSQSQPSEIKFKSQSNKNTSETEGKTSTRKDREEGPPGSMSARTCPSSPPSITKKKRKTSSTVIIPPVPDPRKEPRPHPIMQDPEFQTRYKRFLKRNGLEYGTSDPKKSVLWLRFWDVELKRWYDREEAER